MPASTVIIRAISKRILRCHNISCYASSRLQSTWTQDNIVKSPLKDLNIPNRTISELVFENLDKWSDKTALVCGVTNRSYTYHQFYKYTRNFAANLRTRFNLKDGDVVCIMMPNSPEYGLAVFGALQAGAEVTTVNPIYTAFEVSRQLNLSEPKVIIGVPDTIKVIREAFKIIKKELPIIAVKDTNESLPVGVISFGEQAIETNVDVDVLKGVGKKSEDVAFLPYSSGTTGLPKGVELLNRNIVANCLQLNVEEVRHYDETTGSNQDSALAILPFYHIYGFTAVMLHKLYAGLKIVTLPKFQPDTFLSAMKNHKINLLVAAPPLLLFMGTHKDVTKEYLSHLKYVTSGAAPLPKQDILRVLEKSPNTMQFLHMYGLSETSPVVTSMRKGSNTDYVSAGNALPNTELKIVDSELNSLGPGEVGELLIRGPQVMPGYRNNPEANKIAFTKDGWFRSGDLASINKDGCLYIADRLKELIKVKGYQVPPAELENVLKEHPHVLDAAVVGIPDKRAGEVPKAFIVLKDGEKIDATEITKFVAERVAEYKRIKEVMFLDVLPKNPSGKILRRVLKEKYC